jgi:cysteine desulfurase
VLAGHRFPADRTVILPLDGDGRLDMGALAKSLERIDGRVVLALQAANNETGVIQPVAEAAAMVHARGGLVVCDAVQAFGRMPGSLADWGADLTVISSHKIGGPKGAGALVIGDPALHIEGALVRGGGQERGLRAGTENAPAIAGFAAAAQAAVEAMADEIGHVRALRDRIEAEIRVMAPEAVFFGAGAPRLPNTTAFALPGLPAETLLIALDLAGVGVSSGSACSSGKVRPSHVLQAMGVPAPLAAGALRLSLGRTNTEAEVAVFCETFKKTVSNLRARRARLAGWA